MISLNLPKRHLLAHLPTPIEKMNSTFSSDEGPCLYIKRDDYTGCEFSGNKIRKLEYILPQVIDTEQTVLITCGGIQSNHCRATAAVASRLGLSSHLVLKGDASSAEQGNYFMDRLFGAEITFISDEDYRNNRSDIMKAIQQDYATLGQQAYIIPEGASNGLGMFGYYNAFMEILEQEKQLGVTFDTLCIACGSAGTYGGLYLANELMKTQKNIVGVNIYDKHKDFDKIVQEIIIEGLTYSQNKSCIPHVNFDNIHMIQGYVEGGYGVSTPEELTFIKDFAKREGIILDPVYTGKGMHALFAEIENHNPLLKGNILFIHTGGLFGTFSKTSAFGL